ncbi:MAG: hypothetical protein K8T10_02145 [Candidatus Eremiobacteraeota bacterium]|nr:hypothetical protein [Candidatus Eremiobacteraeota bacterium]
MKITIIGGGSTYTPELVYGILKWKDSPVKTIVLEDIDAERLNIVGDYCRALSDVLNPSINIVKTTDLDESLAGSDFVVTQIRVGGNRKRAEDEKLAMNMGWLGQETTGAVGFLKAFRTIPVMIDIVNRIQAISPNAFLINFTNPAGIISTAIYQNTGKKNMVGLCNVPIFLETNIRAIIQKYAPDLFKKNVDGKTSEIGNKEEDPESGYNLFLSWGGLNHLSWVFDIELEGRSIMEEVLDIITSDDFDPSPYFPVNKEYVKLTRTIPSPYLRYFTETGKVIEELSKAPTRGEQVMKIERNLLDIYKKETDLIDRGEYAQDNPPSLPGELSKRGGADYSRLAVKLIKDLCKIRFVEGLKSSSNRGDSCGQLKNSPVHVLNVPDRDDFFVKSDEFCEIPVKLVPGEKGAISGQFFEPLYPDKNLILPWIYDLVKRVKIYENLTVEASLNRSEEKAINALISNPLVHDRKRIEEFISKALQE